MWSGEVSTSLCWHLGGSQGDIANLTAEDIDWDNRVVSYRRQKTSTVALQHFGAEVAVLFRQLPTSGPLFPVFAQRARSDRATEFKQRCHGLGISGVTLHSYRYAWAERAKQCGYPERFAQEALGHNSKAVHRAYARKAQMSLPSLEDYERKPSTGKVVNLHFAETSKSAELCLTKRSLRQKSWLCSGSRVLLRLGETTTRPRQNRQGRASP